MDMVGLEVPNGLPMGVSSPVSLWWLSAAMAKFQSRYFASRVIYPPWQ